MSEQNFKAIILAGGSGSRLWPLSRELYPKQLLKLGNDETLIQSAFLRMSTLLKPEDILTVTNIKHFSDIKLQLEKISEEKSPILSEPLSKNTAPAIAVGIKYLVGSKKEDPVVIVLPSDHLIKEGDAFLRTVKKGFQLAQKGFIVTLGITPSNPDTGYGYIETSEEEELTKLTAGALKVSKFKEKPDLQTAKQYLEHGGFYWNSGIFIFKASVFLSELKKYAPKIHTNLEFLNKDSFLPSISYRIYEQMPNISIDYAIMEKTEKAVLLPLESDWNDLGSWQSVYDVSEKDENCNVIKGNVISSKCRNSLIYSSGDLVSAVGLEDVILVETEDAVLVCKKEQTQDVKLIFDELKRTKNDLYLVHKTVFRPWGFYTVIEKNINYLIKTIQVQPKHKLSMQLHNHRSEHWTVLSGKAKILLDEEVRVLSPGSSIDIPVGVKHSLQNPYDEELKIVEVQRGDYLSEDDIVRFEDIYGRC